MAEVSVVKPERDPIARWFESEMPMSRGSLFGVNPFALIRQFTGDMDRAFGRAPAIAGNGTAWCPTVEVKEKEEKREGYYHSERPTGSSSARSPFPAARKPIRQWPSLTTGFWKSACQFRCRTARSRSPPRDKQSPRKVKREPAGHQPAGSLFVHYKSGISW